MCACHGNVTGQPAALEHDGPSLGRTRLAWKDDWPQSQQRLLRWWRCEGPAVLIHAPLDTPRRDIAAPEPPDTLRERWIDPDYRARRTEARLAATYFGGDAIPHADTQVSAGDLAPMLGARWDYAPTTVWFTPCIDDPDTHPPLHIDRDNEEYRALRGIIEANRARAGDRYLVCMPDLIENMDILAALRDPQTLMMDLIERPAWVEGSIERINQAYFQIFDEFFELIRDADGGNVFAAFQIWGPGKTAKVQCDASAMFSTDMFNQFVLPALRAQCDWLDYSVYHLDGPEATHHLESLLSIDSLNAIQWQPGARNAPPDDATWHDMLRHILAGGKGVHLSAPPQRVEPLLEALGPAGVYIRTHCETEAEARALEQRVFG